MNSQAAGRQRALAEPKQSLPLYAVRQIAVHLLALTGLVVAQPVFSAYQGNPELFVARSTSSIELIALALLVAVVPPTILAIIAAIPGLFHPRGRMVAAALLVAVLVALLVLQIAARFSGIPLYASIGVATLAGGGAARIYSRRVLIGSYLAMLSPVSALFVGLFLFTPPLSALVVPHGVNAIEGPTLTSDASVVFIVLDELPQVSLLNADEELDNLRYPNFARLAEGATWFRNAAAAYPFTSRSVSSLLSGELPDPKTIASAADFPTSIFTLFAPSHDLHVTEPLTDICPESECVVTQERPASIGSELAALARITYQLYQRIIVPQAFNDRVLTIDDPFASEDSINGTDLINAEINADQRQRFRAFIRQIDATNNQFYFGHFFLPHAPYHYLPSGMSYNKQGEAIPGLDEDDIWSSDPVHAIDSHQRHLLQVGAVDMLLGELIDHLQAIDAFDKSLIVLTSDHGVAHVPGQPRRRVTNATLYDVGLVPLIIKAPMQAEGRIDDRLIQSVDVVPTIADLMGADGPWPGDGVSLTQGEGRSDLYIRDQEHDDVRIDVDGGGRREAVLRLIERFGESGKEQDLFAFGPFAHLVGSPVASLLPGPPVLTASIEDPTIYQFADPGSGFIPAYVAGVVEGGAELATEPHIALALNGVIGAVVPLHDVHDEQDAHNKIGFGGVINDSLFVDGPNTLSVLSLHSLDGRIVANHVKTNVAPRLSVVIDGGTVALQSSNDDTYTVKTDAVEGYIGTATQEAGQITFDGWAIDRATMNPVDAVAVFVGDRFVASVIPSLERKGLAEDFGTDAVLMSGFSITIPAELLREGSQSMEVYGVSGTAASELMIIKPDQEDVEATQ